MQTCWRLIMGCALSLVVACGGSDNGGFNVGGPTSCGVVAPCGGDLTGTWTFTTGCITGVGVKDAESGNSCPGETIAVTGITVSGTMTFNTDMTYAAVALQKQGDYSLYVPASCLAGLSCTDVSTALEGSGAFESASCLGSNGCSCTALQTPAGGSETGTYSVSGTTLTTVASTGATGTVGYCVQGSTLHGIDTSTMSMGPMGQAAIDEDTIGQKQQ